MNKNFKRIWGMLMALCGGIVFTCICIISIGDFTPEEEWGIVFVMGIDILIGVGLLVAKSVLDKPVK